jgi:Rieske Fe-S protein
MTTAKAYEDPGTPEEISRRTFMVGATVVMGGIVGLAVAIPSVATLVPTEEIVAGSRGWWPLDAGEMKQLQASTDKPIKIYFAQHVRDGYIESDVQEYVWGVKLGPGGVEKFKAQRPDLPNLEVVAAGISPYPAVLMNFVMFSSICPHLGCHFDWNDGANKFMCPCHGSQFTSYGQHIEGAGPAPRSLDPLPIRERSGAAEITWIRYKQGVPDRFVVSYS